MTNWHACFYRPRSQGCMDRIRRVGCASYLHSKEEAVLEVLTFELHVAVIQTFQRDICGGKRCGWGQMNVGICGVVAGRECCWGMGCKLIVDGYVRGRGLGRVDVGVVGEWVGGGWVGVGPYFDKLHARNVATISFHLFRNHRWGVYSHASRLESNNCMWFQKLANGFPRCSKLLTCFLLVSFVFKCSQIVFKKLRVFPVVSKQLHWRSLGFQ